MQSTLASSSCVQAAAPSRAVQRTGSQPTARPAAYRQQQHAGARRRAAGRVAVYEKDMTPEDLEDQLADFMRRQAEIESGATTRKAEPGKVLGADEVPEDEAKRYCREVVGMLKKLKEQRDMSLNEVRLTVGIEDPRAREKRLMGMEDSCGISREEMATALMEVSEGKIPADRIALRELSREMSAWPALDEPSPRRFGGVRAAPAVEEPAIVGSSYELSPAAEEAAAAVWRQKESEVVAPAGRTNPVEVMKKLEDKLPDWVGYGFLYLISIAPVLIAAGAITILFLNSLR